MADRVGQQLGNYRLTRLLGEGRLAEVYLAEHIYFKTPSAIKVLRWPLEASKLEYFRAEMAPLVRLNHSHILRILDVGVEGSTAFLVMDYATKGSLRERHRQGEVVALPTVVAYVKQLASALQYAHEQKLVHRAVKPTSMLVGFHDNILLSDFENPIFATYRDADPRLGTEVFYRSPEQLANKPLSSASDQYALGLIVYEWLTGSLPFSGSPLEVAAQHMLSIPSRLREKQASLPADTEEVVMKTLAKDPKDRFASVLAFATALEQASQPSEFVPPARLPLAPYVLASSPPQGASQPSPAVLSPTEVSQSMPTVSSSGGPVSASTSLLNRRYRSLNRLGGGGMGVAYKAADTQFDDRIVAVKEMTQSGLPPEEISIAIETFKREARLLAGLMHPNLPRIYDHFTDEGRWYLVMDFIEGQSLAEYLRTRGGHLPMEEVLEIGLQIATVLDYLHRRQPPIIFRDLKPSNIMHTSDGLLYLVDFGIARHFKPGQTHDTRSWYTPGYAAPEQYGSTQTTGRADLYSLGAMLHQLLSGRSPSETPFRFPPLQLGKQGAGRELEQLISQMVSMEENERPGSAALVKQTLQRLMHQRGRGGETSIPAPSPVEIPLAPTVLATSSPSVPPPLEASMQSEGPAPAAQPPPVPAIVESSSDSPSEPLTPAVQPPPERGTVLLTYNGHSNTVTAVAWSLDGRLIASASNDRTVQVWQARNGQPRLTYSGHSNPVTSVAWSPDRQWIASAGRDKKVQVWQARNSQPRLTYSGHSAPVWCIAWSPDGQLVASASYDGTVQVWQAV